ncbi:MAG: DNA polymerase III subunit delta [Bryobacteraceae bacterium]
MTPEQFLSQIRRQEPAPVYLFLGPEPYRRRACRAALIERVIGGDDREQALTVCDLQDWSLSEVVDDARSLSLFAPRRVIWVSGAEAALPRGRSAAAAGEEETSAGGPLALLAGYVQRPSPGVVVVLDVSRYDLEGEDKARLDRVRKFYGAIPSVVEFPRYTVNEARQLAQGLARSAGLDMDRDAIEDMVDALGADAMHIATEIEKLSVYAGSGGKIDGRELAALVPDSSVSTIFALVDALGRRDRLLALALVDTLVRQGEYMPLALNFLASLFRLALAARERGLRNAQQVQQALSRPGRPVWRSKAEQICQVAATFTPAQLAKGLGEIYAADRGLRDARPSDRIVMERFILALAG